MLMILAVFGLFVIANIIVVVVVVTVGMFAIRGDREYVIEQDFLKAVRKIADNKKLERKLDYKPV